MLITRAHLKGDAASTAVYSDCNRYRYSLERIWDAAEKRVMFVMLNPSKATEVQNDPTVERCEQRARRLGYGGFCVTNIFAWRATDPRDMRAAADPVGSENDKILIERTRESCHIIAAWGTHGAHLGRGAVVAEMLQAQGKPLFHLGLSKAGHPKHPLYLPYARQPIAWFAKGQTG